MKLRLTPRSILDHDESHPHVEGGITHSCTHCGRNFIPKRHWQHFCNRACRETYHNSRAAAPWKPKLDDLA